MATEVNRIHLMFLGLPTTCYCINAGHKTRGATIFHIQIGKVKNRIRNYELINEKVSSFKIVFTLGIIKTPRLVEWLIT